MSQIHLSSASAYRIYDNNIAHAEYYLGNLQYESEYTIYLSVVHCIIPYSYYNINTTNNILNIVLLNSNNNSMPLNTTINITLSPGNYNALNLLTELEKQLPTFKITYNPITNKYIFMHNDYDFIFLGPSETAINSTCLSIIGFSNKDHTSMNKILTSDSQVNLIPVQCICIQSSLNCGNYLGQNVNNHNILVSMPVLVQPFGVINYRNKTGYKINLNTCNLSYITLKLIDQKGNILQLDNNLHYSITIQLDIEQYTA